MHPSSARADDSTRNDVIPVPLLLLLVGCGYFLAARAGQALGPPVPWAASCWPAHAVLLAGMLITPARCWWRVALAALPAHLLAQVGQGTALPLALAGFALNCLEAFAGAAAVAVVLRARLCFDEVRHTLVFLLACTLLAPVVASVPGLVLGVADPTWFAWQQWAAGVAADAAAIALLAPVLAGWVGVVALPHRAPLARHLEGATIAVLLLGVGGAVFVYGAGHTASLLLLYASLGALLWAAIRFGPFGAAAGLLLLACLAVSGTALGRGPFAAHGPMVSPAQLQLLLAALAALLLLLGAALGEARAARRTLRDQDHTLGLALAAARVGVWELDAAAGTVACSSQMRELFGLAPGDAPVPVETLLGRVHPAERTVLRDGVARPGAWAGGLRHVFRVVAPGGEVRWMLGRGAACPDRGRGRVLGVAVDVSEHRRAEALAMHESAMRDSEARFRHLADAMPQVLWAARPDGQVDYANRAWCALAGTAMLPAGDALWEPYICDSDRTRYGERWQRAQDSGEPFELECRFRFPPQPDARWYLARGWPVRDELGRIERWYGTWTDIDTQKQAQQAQCRWSEELERQVALRTAELRHANAVLQAEAARGRRARAANRASEARFARVFRASPVAMALSGGPDGLIRDVNDSWQELFGYKRADAIGKTPRELQLFEHEGEAGASVAPWTGRQARMRRRDGAGLDVALTGARIDNEPDGCFITILRDETGARRRELEVRRQGEQLTYLSRVVVLGELCGAIAHELNQPLAAILANAQAGRRWLARQAGTAPLLPEIFDDIVVSSNRAASVIRRLRALYVQGETTLRPLDIAEVVRETLVLAAGSLAEHQVEVAAAFDEPLGVVRGDRVQLQQVLLNLVVNACEALRATPGGERRLDVACRALPGAAVQLVVADSGPGIAANVLEKMFDSFFTTKPHGLGFGLSVSRAIVVAHGGRIEAANQAGGGAVFRITLPVKRE
jgi:PAS domain S-box-containing protein